MTPEETQEYNEYLETKTWAERESIVSSMDRGQYPERYRLVFSAIGFFLAGGLESTLASVLLLGAVAPPKTGRGPTRQRCLVCNSPATRSFLV
ncbi:MAG: hypothetical protein ACOY5B_09415 [Spirochaetota bacterium]